MRQFLPVAALLAFAVTPNAAIAEPALVPPLTDSTETPESVHVQPRGRAFAPKSAEDEAVQKQLTVANESPPAQNLWLEDHPWAIATRCRNRDETREDGDAAGSHRSPFFACSPARFRSRRG
jgi:hypothetical protein